jgi:DegV family protein with EDD domain
MSKVAIVTDTISCVPPDLQKELDIHIVPTGLILDGKKYKDTELSNDEFWKLFYKSKSATTAAGSPTDFEAVFSELSKTTTDIVCITVSSKLSATHNDALMARQMLVQENPNLNIEVIDSTTATGAMGFIVLEAARVAKAGKKFSEVVEIAESMVSRVKFITVMETLKYLIKSGRAPKSAIIGDWMNVKPIIGMVTGTGLVENLGRATGNKKARAKIVDLAKDYFDSSKPSHFFIHYTDNIEAGEELKQMVIEQYHPVELYMTPYTPVMSSQTGSVVAIAFYS